MPVPSLASFKVTVGEVSSATKFNNLVQAVEDEFGSIQADQIPGGGAVGQFLRGDGWAGALSTWAVAWTATTAPAIGNGTLTGRYLQIGKMIFGQIRLTVGSTTTFGTGIWKFDLPVAAHASVLHHYLVWLQDASAGEWFGMARHDTASSVAIFHNNGAAIMGIVTGTAPFPWTTGDGLVMNFMYEAA